MKTRLLLCLTWIILASNASGQPWPDREWQYHDGSVTYSKNDVINITISSDADNGYDRLHLSSGILTTGQASLNIIVVCGYEHHIGSRFELFKAPEIDGEFLNQQLIDVNGFYFVMSYEHDGSDDLVVLTAVTQLFRLRITTTGAAEDLPPDYSYNLRLVADPPEGGTPEPGNKQVRFCDDVGIIAGTAEGYRFVGWEQSGGAIITGVASPTATASMPAGNVTLTAVFCKPPEAPQALPATKVGTNSFTANWSDVSNTIGTVTYTLDVALDSDFAYIFNDHHDIQVTKTSLAIADVASNETYYYRVRAINECGASDYSNTVSVTTSYVTPFVECGDPITFTYKGQQVTYGTIQRGHLCWMDRNLGTDDMHELDVNDPELSNTDDKVIGDLFQWGRLDDGHQDRGTATTTIQSTTIEPGHDQFIAGDEDWLETPNNSLWYFEDGLNNPCPPGWRVPILIEFLEEAMTYWTPLDGTGAWESDLRWPSGGARFYDGSILNEIELEIDDEDVEFKPLGAIWTSNPVDDQSIGVILGENAATIELIHRLIGMSVRCILTIDPEKEYTLTTVADPETAGTINAPATFKYLDEISVEANPGEGYVFYAWDEEGGADISDITASATTAVMPGRNVTFTATFKALPQTPTALPATGQEAVCQFTANWEEADHADYYELHVAADEEFGVHFTYTTTLTSQDITGLATNTTYYYRVRALNDYGISQFSNTVSVTTSGLWECGCALSFTYRNETVTYGTVLVEYGTPEGEKCWLDRNLGADPMPFVPSVDATGNTDPRLYGDLFQWGRLDDGHQDIGSVTNTTLSDTDIPGHGDFIIVDKKNPGAGNWLSYPNDNLWQGVDGPNNPCPPGWRVPTEDELTAESEHWDSKDQTGAFASGLKWPLSGMRSPYIGNSDVSSVGYLAFIWSSTVSNGGAKNMVIESEDVRWSSDFRTFGKSVRCVKGDLRTEDD